MHYDAPKLLETDLTVKLESLPSSSFGRERGGFGRKSLFGLPSSPPPKEDVTTTLPTLPEFDPVDLTLGGSDA